MPAIRAAHNANTASGVATASLGISKLRFMTALNMIGVTITIANNDVLPNRSKKNCRPDASPIDGFISFFPDQPARRAKPHDPRITINVQDRKNHRTQL